MDRNEYRMKQKKKRRKRKSQRNKMVWSVVCLLFVLGAGFALYKVITAENFEKNGTEFLEQKKYEKAIAEFEKIVSKGTEPEDGYLGIGLAKYEQGEYKEALKAFEKAIQKETHQTAEVYRLMGICDMELEDYQKALNSFNLGIAKTEEEKDCEEIAKEMRRSVVACYEQTEDWENACQKAEEYMKLYPEDTEMQKELQFLRSR